MNGELGKFFYKVAAVAKEGVRRHWHMRGIWQNLLEGAGIILYEVAEGQIMVPHECQAKELDFIF